MKNTIPSEKVEMHLNNDILVSGETLYYNIFCLNTATNTLSNISKIAYVELLGANSTKLFKHKIKLENGIGYSEFFIPAAVETGHYKLIGYTQWMKNNTEKPFFQKDVYIINPFVPYTNLSKNEEQNSITIKKTVPSKLHQDTFQNIVLKPNSRTYKTRERVVLEVQNPQGVSVYGNYSLTVRKLDSIGLANNLSFNSKAVYKNDVQFYLPEIRGEIVSGRVVLKENVDINQPNIIVSLSIPGENPIYKNVITDDNGRFFFNIHQNYTSSKCVLQILDKNRENFQLHIDDTSFAYHNVLEFKNLQLSPELEDWLVSRSINNQVENAYSDIKQDSTLYRTPVTSFYGKPTLSYTLDDYKRFPTVRETFVEVIEGAGIRKHKDGYSLKVYRRDEFEDFSFDAHKPLVLLDGVLIQDYEYLVDYNPYKIENISLLKGIYFIGPSVFDGIIDVKTKDRDFYLPRTTTGFMNLELGAPQGRKNYYAPNYGKSDDLERIPDYRHQLLWSPVFNLNSDLKIVEFYTSDVEGVFEITLEGYTQNGQYINSKAYFEVKD